MISRRQFIASATATSCGLMTQQACSLGMSVDKYEQAISSTWRHSLRDASDSAVLRLDLVRYATLAPSSHNTQCWKFFIEEHAISILPDLLRRCPSVDPDDHHLFVSLGCAAENLMQAALANGLKGEAHFDAVAAGGIRIALEPSKAVVSPLFQAIIERQSTRAEFDGKQLSIEELRLLEQAGTGDGVQVLLLTEKASMENILEYVVQGNSAQMNDPSFVAELKTWIRFSRDEAVRTGDGLFSGTTGNPSVPRWLGSLLFGILYTQKSENDKYVKQVRSSAGIAIFVSEENNKAHWVEVGRCYERFALQSAALGIRNAMINQPVEVPVLRPQVAAFLGIRNRRPDLIVRFGRGPKMPHSQRRPVQEVLA